MEPGTVIAGRFALESLAGEGGMSVVYRAIDRLTGEVVALKVLRELEGLDPERFTREAQILAGLSHPAIVRYIAHGSLDGRAWLAMEWLTGEDLYDRLERQGLTVAEAVTVARRVSEALAVAHGRGIVHRDIKPPNVFLPGGEVARACVLDFGIARHGHGQRALTRTGAVLGTPGYMAPEQVRGERDIDARADLFSLGCLLFECLTGRPAFEGDTPVAILAKILVEEAPRVSTVRADIPPALDALVARLTARRRDERPHDAQEVIAALDALGDLTGLRAPTLSAPSQGITHGEQRLVCAVAVGPRKNPPAETFVTGDVGVTHAQTLLSSPPPAAWSTLKPLGERFGGRSTVLGEVLVTVFAAEGVARDLVARAARCALAFSREAGPLGVAMVTGRAELFETGAAGEAIERAIAMVTSPPNGTGEGSVVWLDEVSAMLLGPAYAVESEGGTHTLCVSCPLWDDEVSEPERLAMRELLGRRLPCVGRERELATLAAVLEETLAEGSASAVVVTGPTGIGKSRLVGEFVARARAGGDAVEVWYAQGEPWGAGAPFALLGAMLRRAAGIYDGTPLDLARASIRQRFGALVPEGDTLAWVAALAGVPFTDEEAPSVAAARDDAQWRGDAMLRAWEALLTAAARRRPLVIVFDNVQWGDGVSLRFVGHALEHQSDAPWMVLAVGRDELSETFPKLWESVGVQQLRLGPLSRRSAERLGRLVLGEGVSPELLTRVVEHAGGVPSFLEELLRMAETPGALPATVVAMVQARFEAMEPEARRVLRAASVFGSTFWRAGLATLLGGSATTPSGNLLGDLDGWLAELVRREVIERRAAPRFPNETEWSFRSEHLAAAAYATLTERDRVQAHALAGHWLRSVGESNPLALADHFLRGHCFADAAGAFGDAARHALEGHDLDGALTHARAVLSAAAQARSAGEASRELDVVEARAHLVEAEVRLWRGEPQQAHGPAVKAMALLPMGSAEWFRAAGEAGTALGRAGRYDLLDRWIEQVSDVPPAPDALAAWAIAFARVSVHLYYAGRMADADRMLRAVELGLAGRDPGPLAEARLAGARAARASMRSDGAAVEAHTLAALAAYERAGDLRNACTQRSVLGLSAERVGRFDDAERWQLAALELAQRLRLPMATGMALSALGRIHFATGQQTRGINEAQQGVVWLAATEHSRLEAIARAGLAWMHFEAGAFEAADAEAARAYARGGLAPVARRYALSLRARICLRRNELSTARALLDEALAIDEDDRAIIDGETLTDLARVEVLLAQGDTEAARAVAGAGWARLTERASYLPDEAARAAFFQRIPLHRELEAWCQRLGITAETPSGTVPA
jgi:tetratricopeptide (TPR) repeat protein